MLLILAFLWVLDAFLSIDVLRKKGFKKETNILLRDIFRQSAAAFLAFKLIDLVFVIAVIFLLSIQYLVTAQTILFIFIYVYYEVDRQNFRIWKKMRLKGTVRKRALKKEIRLQKQSKNLSSSK